MVEEEEEGGREEEGKCLKRRTELDKEKNVLWRREEVEEGNI